MSGVRSLRGRSGAVLAVAIVAVLLLVLILGGGGANYTLHVQFRDASQLIKGDLVEVGGLKVGKVSDLRLTPGNNADVVVHITDSRFAPLHEGTTAAIGTVGLASITNRFVAINPGPTNTATIPNGATLDETRTRPIVDLDELLNSLTPPVLKDLQTIIDKGAVAFQSPLVGRVAFHYSNPAFGQLASLTGQVVADKAGFSALLHSGATVANTLSAHAADLQKIVTGTARAMSGVASERSALSTAIAGAPGVLNQADGTLRRLRAALTELNPTLQAAQPIGRPLADVLRAAAGATHVAPTVTHLVHTLPSLEAALNGVPALRDSAKPVLAALVTTAADLLPIATGLRPYTPDIVQGLTRGLGGASLGQYDANGHFATVLVPVSAQSGLNGTPAIGPALTQLLGSIPTLNGLKTGYTSRCPGSAGPPLADSSNPWTADTSTCDPSQLATPDH